MGKTRNHSLNVVVGGPIICHLHLRRISSMATAHCGLTFLGSAGDAGVGEVDTLRSASLSVVSLRSCRVACTG